MKTKTPVVRSFLIEGLHGYKDVSIDFEHHVKIVIAENGAGKTTILNAIDAFLKADFIRLKNIPFERIKCVIGESDTPLTLERKALLGHQQPALGDSINSLSKYVEGEDSSQIAAIAMEFDETNPEAIKDSPALKEVYFRSPYDWSEIVERIRQIKLFYSASMTESARDVLKQVKESLSAYEILYLPTYRRIEKPKARTSPIRNRRVPVPRRMTAPNTAQINYGLEDVDRRLAELSDDIQRRSNIGYRNISAAIIDDLLMDRIRFDANSEERLPDRDTLVQFFSRIGSDSQNKLQYFLNAYSDDPVDISPTLRYFLSKLSQVVNQTNDLEEMIRTFVDKVNSYLSGASDKKKLIYDPVQAKVSVVNEWTGNTVEFDDLSSGEKQVISLLAYLFLYNNEKIVLIDEPELSLSIEWQQKILPDVVSSPYCRQLLSITHSPFIFENELDSFGSSLKIVRHAKE